MNLWGASLGSWCIVKNYSTSYSLVKPNTFCTSLLKCSHVGIAACAIYLQPTAPINNGPSYYMSSSVSLSRLSPASIANTAASAWIQNGAKSAGAGNESGANWATCASTALRTDPDTYEPAWEPNPGLAIGGGGGAYILGNREAACCIPCNTSCAALSIAACYTSFSTHVEPGPLLIKSYHH